MHDATHARPRILLVDDNTDARDAMAFILENAGYDVLHAGNGREALDVLVSGQQVCIILLDLTMPVMDGFEFRKAQLADERIAHVPVIIYSAISFMQTDIVRNALKPITILRKPIPFHSLLETLAEHCRR